MPSCDERWQVAITCSTIVGREPFGRLVHDQQLRVREQGAADREHLLLAARELRGADPLALGEAREELVDGARRPAARARGADHLQVLVGRERLEETPALRHVRDARLRDLVRRPAQQLLPAKRTDPRADGGATPMTRCRASSCPCRCGRSPRRPRRPSRARRPRAPARCRRTRRGPRSRAAPRSTRVLLVEAAAEVDVVHHLVGPDLGRRALDDLAAVVHHRHVARRRSARRPCRARSGSASRPRAGRAAAPSAARALRARGRRRARRASSAAARRRSPCRPRAGAARRGRGPARASAILCPSQTRSAAARARARVLAVAATRRRGRSRPPSCPTMARKMLSSTDRPGKSRVFWYVRASPSFGRTRAGRASRPAPSPRSSPSSAGSRRRRG